MRFGWPLLAALLFTSGLSGQEPVGQFGPYHWQNKQLRLPGGDTLTVFRVKYWVFNDGAPPGLQLEYEAPYPVSDTAALHQLLRRLWPAFVPYVESMHLSNAIVTATNMTRHGAPPLPWTATFHSWGYIVQRDSAGGWRVKGDGTGEVLPPSLGPDVFLIFEASGSRVMPGPIREEP